MEIKLKIKKEITDSLCIKLKFKKLSDSLKCMISKIENNEENLSASKNLFTKLLNSHFQHTFSSLFNYTKADMRALKMYKKKRIKNKYKVSE